VLELRVLIYAYQSRFLKSPSLPFHSLISILTKFPTDVDSRVFWSSAVRDLLYGKSHRELLLLGSLTNTFSFHRGYLWFVSSFSSYLIGKFITGFPPVAAQMLLSRIDNFGSPVIGESEYSMNLVLAFASAALDCQGMLQPYFPGSSLSSLLAFTTRQLSKFAELLKSNSIELPASSTDAASSDPSSSPSSANDELETPDSRDTTSRVYMTEGEVGWEPTADTEVVAELAKEFGVEAQLVQALAQRLVALH